MKQLLCFSTSDSCYDSSLFDLTATLYLNLPSADLLFSNQSISQGSQSAYEDLIIVCQDYRELFFTPLSGRFIAPFESVQVEGRMWGDVTREIGELYNFTGFDPACVPASIHWSAHAVPDHIGYELAFFSALLRSREKTLPGERELIEQTIDYVWHDHLMRWVPQYGEKLTHRARTPFYRFLGRLTTSLFCQAEREKATMHLHQQNKQDWKYQPALIM